MTPLAIVRPEQLYIFSSELLMIHRAKSAMIWDKREFGDLFLSLLSNFDSAKVYGDFDEVSKIKYFIYILKLKDQAVMQLLYTALDVQSKTKQLLKQVKEDLKKEECRDLGFISHNITSSFKRWAKSLDAETVSINYQIQL